MEFGAPLRPALGPQSPTMRRHQRAADRQAHAQAALLGGVERLEQPFDVVWQTDSAVQYGDAHLILLDESLECESAVARWIRLHRVARIHREVEKDLLELHTVRQRQRKVVGDEIGDGDTTRDEIAAGYTEQIFERLLHAHRP